MDGTFADIDAPIALKLEGQPREMSDLVRAFDWGATPLGHSAFWPAGLKTTVRIMLTSRFPMWMFWGPELTMLYNDAYAQTTLGKKHPWALGKPASIVWSEVWKDVWPRIERVLETGEASWDETLFLPLERGGYPEETYHTFSYSPLAGPDGGNAGMLCVVMEDTGRVLGERQLASLGTLARALVDASTRAEVFDAIERGLEGQKDISFALLYLFEEGAPGSLKLAVRCGIESGHPAACEKLLISAVDCPWPVEFLSSNEPVTVENLSGLFSGLPTGSWDRPPQRARIVPFARKGQETPAGIFIAGVNPYRQLDASYAGYLDLIAGQIAASIRNAEAFEEEKTRVEALAELDRATSFAWEALEHIPDSFATLDRDYRLTYMNAAANRITSAMENPHVGRSLWELYPMLLGTPVEEHFRRTMEQRVAVEFEQYFRSDIAEKWYQFQLYPQPDEGLIVYMRETTEARRTEQALRRSEQLAAAGRLAASIAHEINNPLEAVTNLLYLVKMDEALSSSSSGLLDVADRELQRLSHITSRSLKFYRQRTAPSLTPIDDLIESVLFFHETEVRMRNIELRRRYRTAPTVLCLAGEIQQVFTNLISNALEAMEDKGKLSVGVCPSRDCRGSAGVAVTIADTGIGMDRLTIERLFHPFVTTKGESGTGLGLWVSKGILDKHHGTIRVRSRKEKGTVFRIFLPLDTTAENREQGTGNRE